MITPLPQNYIILVQGYRMALTDYIDPLIFLIVLCLGLFIPTSPLRDLK